MIIYKLCKKYINWVEREMLCDHALKNDDGKCEGYCRSNEDDEPSDMCKECKQHYYYEE